MSVFKLIGVIRHEVSDTFLLEVEADNPEEAQDVAYEVLSEYPNSVLSVKQLLKVGSEYSSPDAIHLEFQRDEVEQVFEEENDDGDDDGPRYA